MELSIITATYRRPFHLAQVMHAVRQAEFDDVEHIVILDGPDPASEYLCRSHPEVRWVEISHGGCWGAPARDAGIAVASGRYLAFWDDDNVYYTAAVQHLRQAVLDSPDSQLLIFQVEHIRPQEQFFRRIPPVGQRELSHGDVDTMCLCVAASLARQVPWADGGGRGHDFRWQFKVGQLAKGVQRVPVSLGEKIDLYNPHTAVVLPGHRA